ncbi:MAG: hypothetical protein LUQ13_04075, partial [Methanomicrobiales archaeon]|nr:hypothetical protein [Methanomicrobiales archaeon]
MAITYTESIAPQRWRSIVTRSPFGYVYHTPEWVKVLEVYGPYRNATRLYNVDGTEVLIPMMEEKRWGMYLYESLP